MNKVFEIGFLTREPEKVEGQDLCKLTMAVRNDYKNKDGEYDSEFFNLSVWGKLSESCLKYLHKGSQVAVEGSLHIRTYEKDGIKRYLPEITVKSIEFIGTPKAKEEKVEQKPELEPIQDDFLPF